MEQGNRKRDEEEREERERQQAKKARLEEAAKGKKPVDQSTKSKLSTPTGSGSDSFETEDDFADYVELAPRPPKPPRQPNAPQIRWLFRFRWPHQVRPWLHMHLFPCLPPWAYLPPPWELPTIKCDVSNFAETVQRQTGYSPSPASSSHLSPYTAQFLRETFNLPTLQNVPPHQYLDTVYNEITRLHDGNRMTYWAGSSSSSSSLGSEDETNLSLSLGPSTNLSSSLGPSTDLSLSLGPSTKLSLSLGPSTKLSLSLGPSTNLSLSLGPSNVTNSNVLNQEQARIRVPSSGGSSSSSTTPSMGNSSTSSSPYYLDDLKNDGDPSSSG